MTNYNEAIASMDKTFSLCATASINENKTKLSKEQMTAISRKIDDLELDNPSILNMVCVHTSTGFNKNDHYFIPEELFAAKESVLYQMVDLEHDRDDVVGCITGYATKTFDGEDFTAADLEMNKNASFDLQTDIGVWIYKKEDFANELLKKYEEGKLYVSMECSFDDFDFALETPQGEVALVKRSEETNFLAKYMRKFGGEGSYKGYKIGMAFRGINFIGVGIVSDPANPRSEVLDIVASEEDFEKNNENFEKIIKSLNDSDFVGVTSNATASNGIKKETKGEKDMDLDKLYEKAQKDVEEAKDKITSLEKEKEVVASEKDELAKALEKMQEEAKQVAVYSRKDSGENEYSYVAMNYDGNEVKVTENTVYDTKSVTTVTEELVAEAKAAKEESEAVKKELEEAKAELEKIEKAKKDDERKAAVAELDVEVEEEEILSMSDESFAAMVKFAPKKQAEASEKPKEEEKEKTEEETASVASEEIENVEDVPVQEVEASEDNDKEDEDVKNAIASIIG